MEPTKRQIYLKRVGDVIIWALIIVIELWLLRRMYYPLSGNYEAQGANIANLFYMVLVAWIGYRTLKSKKK